MKVIKLFEGGKWYTDGTRTVKVYSEDQIPDGFYPGVHYRHASWNKGLTKETDERVAANGLATQKTRLERDNYNAWNKGLTKEDDPRIKGLTGELNGMYGKHPTAWNKGLTKFTDSRMAQASVNHKGVTAWNKGKKIGSFWTDESARKSYETRIKNGTLGINQDTKAEQDIYHDLLKSYNPEDIIHPYLDKDRYPFKCDFYIISEDRFIEVHGNWTHGGRPYIEGDPECEAQLAYWKEKAETSDYYKNAIYTWTTLDVRKVKIAQQNGIRLDIIYYNY